MKYFIGFIVCLSFFLTASTAYCMPYGPGTGYAMLLIIGIPVVCLFVGAIVGIILGYKFFKKSDHIIKRILGLILGFFLGAISGYWMGWGIVIFGFILLIIFGQYWLRP